MPSSANSPDSVRQHGVIQPIVVRPVKGAQDRYEIIAGERRWRAAQLASLHEVPIVPIDVSDSDALEIMIIENVQREDLNAMEEAQGYHALADEFKRSQEEIAKEVGKSRSHVANMMRLTKLPAEVQAFIANGQLSAGHARALIGVPDPLAAAKRIVEEGLNVRQTEALAHEEGVPERKPQKARARRRQDKRSRHDRAGEARQRCTRSCRDRQPPRPRRHRPDQLSQPRTARRGDAAAGEGGLIGVAHTLHGVVFAILYPKSFAHWSDRRITKAIHVYCEERTANRCITPRICVARKQPMPHCFASLAMTPEYGLYPRRFAFAAIESSVRWAIADASDACLRMSSAAVPS